MQHVVPKVREPGKTLYVFGDESGNLDFSRRPGATRFYLLATVTYSDTLIERRLVELQRELALNGLGLESPFHATEDLQVVRDAVFEVLRGADIRIDVTLFDKPKTQPHLQHDHERFYKTLWYMHMKHVAPRISLEKDEMLVVAASVGTKKRRKATREGIVDVMRQSTPNLKFEVAFWPAASDPGLWIADYVAWAIYRKWESNDQRSYDLIKNKIHTEFDCFRQSSKLYF